MASKAEVAEMMAVLVTAYPSAKVTERTIDVYYDLLQDIPAANLSAAAKNHMATAKWFPQICELIELCDVTGNDQPSAEAAWLEALDGIRSHGISSMPKWSTGTVARTVRAIGWHVLCDMGASSKDFIHQHFVKTYQSFSDDDSKRLQVEFNKIGDDRAKDIIGNVVKGVTSGN